MEPISNSADNKTSDGVTGGVAGAMPTVNPGVTVMPEGASDLSAPASPVVNPVINPATNPVVNPVINSAMNPVVTPASNPVINPVINPAAQAAPVIEPTMPPVMAIPDVPVMPGAGVPGIQEPIAPVFEPVGENGFSATQPLTMPQGPATPDPLEEELKAPLRPAAPVPGSIGSAVSGPALDGMGGMNPEMNAFNNAPRTPSVAFNDPATEPDKNGKVKKQPKTVTIGGKKVSQTTLILLGVVAVAVIVALVFVLVSML